MRSAKADKFEVTTAATDLTLLSEQELRLAITLAVDDDSKDDLLEIIGARAAANITTAAKVRSDGTNPTTLRSESVRDTFYLRCPADELELSRRFVSSITSVVENDMTLDAADYLLNPESGLLKRLQSDWPAWWPQCKIVIEYVAGFATVPDELKDGAAELVQIRTSEGSRDPLVKSTRTNVPEMDDRQVEYWVGDTPGSDSGGPLPESVATKLARFILPTFG